MAEERNAQLCKLPVERDVLPVAGVKPLRIGQHLHQSGPCFGAAFQLFDGISPLRVDGDTRQELIWIRSGNVQDVIVSDEKFRALQIQLSISVIDTIHPEKNRFVHVLRFPQLCEQVVHILLIGPRRILRVQIVLPREKLEDRATEYPGGNVAPVLLCPERRQVNMAINHPVSPSRPCATIGRSGTAVGRRLSCCPHVP